MPSSEGRSPNDKHLKGKTYERLAAEYFAARGFDIIERNWRAGHKEIDLIVSKGKLIVFVEVKSGSSKEFGHPAERVDDKKMAHLTEAAQAYLVEHRITGCDLRFDVVTFVKGRLEHFPDAFPAAE